MIMTFIIAIFLIANCKTFEQIEMIKKMLTA